jgi:hypothetical protein
MSNIIFYAVKRKDLSDAEIKFKRELDDAEFAEIQR